MPCVRAVAQGLGINFGKNVKILTFLKTPRLLRLGKLLRFLERMKGANIFRIFRLIFIMVLLCHWLTCGWHYIAWQLANKEPTWFYNLGRGKDDSLTARYLEGFYLMFCAMGGQNIVPVNNAERLYASIVLLIGAMFYATIIGNMALLVSNLNATNARHKHKQELVMDVVRYLGLPQDISDRVQEYYEYLANFSHPGPDGMKYLQDLPSSLYEDVSMYLHGDRVRMIPLFASVEDAFVTSLVTRLHHAVYMPSEIVFRAGDVGHEMYLIYKGKVAVINSHGETVAILREGGFFGELALVRAAARLPSKQQRWLR